MTRIRAANALLVLLSADLLGVMITGNASFLTPGRAVGPWGFVTRALAVAAVVAFRFAILLPPERRMEKGRLALVVLLFPTLVQFQILGARLNGDGISYYVFVRSLLKDRDFDLADESGHCEIAIETAPGAGPLCVASLEFGRAPARRGRLR